MPSDRFSLARRLRAGETVHTGWCGLGAPIVAELIARAGFPAVTLDQQHGLYTMDSTAAGIAAVHMAGAAPMVRVPLGDFAVVSRVLDFGAEGVIAPMINTAEDARTFALSVEPPVNFSRPSIDVLFESAAAVYGPGLVGVLLSGASADGAAGLGAIQARGGRVFCQSAESAIDPTMPRAGCAAVRPDRIGSPEALGLALSELSP